MTVVSEDREISCDYMIISLCADLAPVLLPGFDDSAYNAYTLDGVKNLRDDLMNFKGGDVVVLVSSMPYKCPAAPYEYALLLDALFRKKGIRDKVNLKVFTPETLPMPVAGPVIGNRVKSLLESRGTSFNPQIKAVSIDSKSRKIIFEKGDSFHFDLIIGKPLPKAGVFAHFEADIVADNIIADITGLKERKAFDGRGYCFLETGFGKAGFASGRFFAEPDPVVNMKAPGRIWHWGKVLFEKWWLRHWS